MHTAPFGPESEGAIIGVALDFPEFFTQVLPYLTPDLFTKIESQYLAAQLLKANEQYGLIPSRRAFRSIITKDLTTGFDNYEEVLAILDTESDPREVPVLKDALLNWVRQKTYGLLYSPETIELYHRGEYTRLNEIVSNATRVQDTHGDNFWLFKNFETVFQEDAIEHLTTGFPQLNAELNNGGPSPGEVVVWLAPTGVGKSICLVNNGVSCVRDGHNVLYITYEMSTLKTAMRTIGAATGVNIREFKTRQDEVRTKLLGIQHHNKADMLIKELPPGECSVDNVYAIIDSLKRQHSWVPKVVVLDYLELMVSRHSYNNQHGDYTAQKHVATEVRGLARNEKVLIFTATQGNRSSTDTESNLGLDRIAESYAKAMPLDYVISINQTEDEYLANPSSARFWIAKNREGRKFISIGVHINYHTMRVREPGQP